jgi:hypothetical protein
VLGSGTLGLQQVVDRGDVYVTPCDIDTAIESVGLPVRGIDDVERLVVISDDHTVTPPLLCLAAYHLLDDQRLSAAPTGPVP